MYDSGHVLHHLVMGECDTKKQTYPDLNPPSSGLCMKFTIP